MSRTHFVEHLKGVHIFGVGFEAYTCNTVDCVGHLAISFHFGRYTLILDIH